MEQKPLQKRGAHFFEQKDHLSCGLAATNSILSMYGKKPKEHWDTKDGSSTKMIMNRLRKNGIKSEGKTITSDKIKPKSIAYYPKKEDHYVTIEKVSGDKLYINDSSKKSPSWVNMKDFEKKWIDKNNTGYVIETSL